MKTAQRRCPCCAADRVAVLHRQEFCGIDEHPLASGYDVVSCDFCGFVYADSEASQEVYDAYYDRMSKYADVTTGTGGALQPWDAERLRDTATTIAEYLGRSDCRILDIGCANGGLLACLKDRGFRSLTGIDPSAGCVTTTKARGFEAAQGFLGKIAATGQTYDCVILSHVLEHVADLRAAMANALSLLAPGGCMYVEVPDATRYTDFLYAPFQDFNTEHINHFSQATLRNLMTAAGTTPAAEAVKTIHSSATSLYPALWGFFVRGSGTRASVSLDHLVGGIRTYIDASRRMMCEIRTRAAQGLADTEEVVIWGTGQLAMKVLVPEVLGRTSIVACVDANPINHGRRFHGAATVAPEAIRGTRSPILITSLLHQTDIQGRIRALGVPNRVITLRDQPEVPFPVN